MNYKKDIEKLEKQLIKYRTQELKQRVRINALRATIRDYQDFVDKLRKKV